LLTETVNEIILRSEIELKVELFTQQILILLSVMFVIVFDVCLSLLTYLFTFLIRIDVSS